jgi:glutathione peroxidase
MASRSVHDFTARSIDGIDRPLSDYRGRALLIVNTASKCGFTPQYRSLQALYEEFRDRGFEVLAFPSNDFMNQEPGTDEEIREFCSTRFHATFPLFAKISVRGKGIHPLYAYLTRDSEFPGGVRWNFSKFLVSPGGAVVARYDSMRDPMSRAIRAKLESILPGT